MSGIFKYPSTLKPEAYQRLKKDLVAQSVGLHNAHIPLLLEGGMTYERISIPPEDAQFIATRKFQKTEIATIYGIPPHMIADLERATNNNIEHQSMEFVTYYHTLSSLKRSLKSITFCSDSTDSFVAMSISCR